jgi:soluble lytic murein transglycosylase-like protein
MTTWPMKTILTTAVFCLAIGRLAIPVHAQLPYYVDDRGNVVYTNDDARHAAKTAAPSAAVKPSAGANSNTADADSKPNSSDQHTANSANSAPTAHPLGGEVLHQLVQETAHKHNVDPNLVSAVISTESNWNASAISSKGALGLMQLVPETAQHFGAYNPFDPTQNVEAGVTYLSNLLERYNGDLPKALAAYNAGPRAVDRWGGVPDYRETREYVRKVTSSYFQPGSQHQPWHAASRPIYRATTDDGRVIFTNE